MKSIVAALSILGGALPLAALIVGARRLIAEHNKLAGQLDEIDRIVHDDAVPRGDKTARCREILVPESTASDVLYMSESIRRAIMSHALDDLRGPARWAATGVVCGTVASVWSLWL